MRPFPVLCALLPCLAAGPAAAAYEFLWENFEREINWEASTGGAATGRVVSEEFASDGSHSLKLLFTSVAASGRASYYRSVDADWSPYGALLLDVYNPTDLAALETSVILTTTDRYLSHEIFLPPLAPGWNRDLRVDLLSRRFITAGSDFKPKGFLVGRGDVKSFLFVIHPGEAAEGALYLDRIRLVRSGVLSTGPLTLNVSVDATGSAGNIDYLPPDMRFRSSDLTRIESFESGATWTNPGPEIRIENATDRRSHGATALGVTFPASPDGFELTLDGLAARLAGTRQLRFDVYNEGSGASLVLRLVDDAGNEYESEARWVPHGWSTPVFDFTNQNVWNGTVIGEAILSRLAQVHLRITSSQPGRLVFDGLSAGSVTLRGATRAGAGFSLAYHPRENLEANADLRVEDTVYGRRLSGIRAAEPEAYLESARIRSDVGGFRTAVLYRERINPMDQPRYLLVSPHNLGREIAAVETAGRLAGFEIQGLAASRLEYERYNSRRPTAFGPEQVFTLRARRNLDDTTRVGATHVAHIASYPNSVRGIPERRFTWGADIETFLGGEGRSLNATLEGGVTAGERPAPVDGAPNGDRGYVSGGVNPEWGRVSAGYAYTQFGYAFDADLTTFGGNWAEHLVHGGVDLEDWWWLKALERVPLYDRSLGRNLRLSARSFAWKSRDTYLDAASGERKPRARGSSTGGSLGNDYKARPNFFLEVEQDQYADQWYRSRAVDSSIWLRVPGPARIVASGSVKIGRETEWDVYSGELGRAWERVYSIGAERHFDFNLFLGGSAAFVRSRRGWEGVWGDVETHAKATWSARQVLGPNTSLELQYGVPALRGYDFGLQDTIDVYTVSLSSTF